MIALSINLNKIALIRNSRETTVPDVVAHARKCLDAGADGITVHPRPDQRHIRASDVTELATMLTDEYPQVEFNIEGNPFAAAMQSDRQSVSNYPGFMQLVEQVRPAQCTLVPDSNAQLTSDHGFDLRENTAELQRYIEQCQALNCRVSLFMDPDCEQIKRARDIGADRIELYTGPYADACLSNNNVTQQLEEYFNAARCALDCGLGINAGHDLNLQNLPRFIEMPGLQEVSIGHAFTIDCIEQGLVNAVQAYTKILH